MGNKKLMISEKRKRILPFILMLGVFAVVCTFMFFDRGFTPQNTTVFAFSYKYGFISRAFLGTVWQVLNMILPFNLMSYNAIYLLSKLITVLFTITVLFFIYICLMRCNKVDERNLQYLACLFAVIAFPFFVTERNFGRIDVYLVILTLLCCILIIVDKYEWLVLPITTICMLMHHGYVFMYLNLILVLLFYKALMKENKRIKYIVLFVLTFLIASVFFLYFEFFSHPEGVGIYEEVVAMAKALSVDGVSIGESLINHEILGMDVFEEEWTMHLMNYWETPLFVIFFFPYIVIGLHYFTNLFKRKNLKEKWCYLATFIGIFTILPQMILKVDYGRYMFTFFFYYIVIIMCLVAMGDKNVARQLEDTKIQVKDKISVGQILVVYPFIFMPFLDVEICSFFWKILGWIVNGGFC